MRIRGGHTIEVFREDPKRKDRHGDKVRKSIGTIDHVVMVWGSSSPMDYAEEFSSTATEVFCPRDAAIRLKSRDRFKHDGSTYVVVGDPSWDENNPTTGYNFGYYTAQVMGIS